MARYFIIHLVVIDYGMYEKEETNRQERQKADREEMLFLSC